jgi:site-specific recombinase XerC
MAWGFAHRPLADEEIEALRDAAEDIGDVLDQATVEGLARTGLRIGEWTHMREEWLSADRDELRIGAIESCDCGECRRERAEPLRDAREEVLDSDKPFGDWQGLTENGAVVNRYVKYARRAGVGKNRLDYFLDNEVGVWFPKSESGARVVPVPDSETMELIEWALELEGRGDQKQWPITRHGMSKRLDKLADYADLRNIHFHRFRHAYGTMLAGMGFSAHEIMSAMGHSEIEQSLTYIEFSGERIHDSFSRKWEGIGDD